MAGDSRKVDQIQTTFADHIPDLLDRAFIIEHEGFYLSVVARPDPDVGQHDHHAWTPVAA